MNQPDAQAAAKRDRSPSYPAISLQTATKRLVALDEYFKRHPAPVNKIGLAWGMKPSSSQASSTVAALKAYGLVEYQGSGADLRAIVSDEGRTYLRAQQETVKREVLKRAAVKPKAMGKYWGEWGAKRPPDPVALDELVLKAKFSQPGAESFLKIYDATMSYAGLTLSDKASFNDEKEGEVDHSPPSVDVGDYIQWESGGALAFPEARRVRAVQQHESATWVFVDGSETGIPLAEVMVERKGEAIKPPILVEEARLPNEREWLRGPLSKESSYRLLVTGDIGLREIRNLINVLEAQKGVLSDIEGD